MEMQREENRVYFFVKEEELEPFGVTLEQMRLRKPFKVDILDYLADKAFQEYGKKYDYEWSNMKFEVFSNFVLIRMTEKSNIVYLENDYIEEETIIDGIQDLFRSLPDEMINTGIMDVKEKRELLDAYRSEEGRELIREEFLD